MNTTGTDLNQITYDPFGNVLSQTNSAYADRFLFAGMQYDPATGLYYDHARYYDAAIGRFTSQDPKGFSAEDTNIYRYGNNTPTNTTDPSGLQVKRAPYREPATPMSQPKPPKSPITTVPTRQPKPPGSPVTTMPPLPTVPEGPDPSLILPPDPGPPPPAPPDMKPFWTKPGDYNPSTPTSPNPYITPRPGDPGWWWPIFPEDPQPDISPYIVLS